MAETHTSHHCVGSSSCIPQVSTGRMVALSLVKHQWEAVYSSCGCSAGREGRKLWEEADGALGYCIREDITLFLSLGHAWQSVSTLVNELQLV